MKGVLFSALRRCAFIIIRKDHRNCFHTSVRGNSLKTHGPMTYEFATKLALNNPDVLPNVPIYRVMGRDGQVEDLDVRESDVYLNKDLLLRMYEIMVLEKTLGDVLSDAEQSGKITLSVTSYGEEAAVIGSAAALQNGDLVFPQYRESGVLLWRGVPVDRLIDQCFGNIGDYGLGRQMPVHYGSRDCNVVTVSSPLATQMPQAVGAAYAFKRQKRDICAVCYFGEGSASMGDAHAAFNFAATLDCPVIFFCRNNQIAISTPVEEQYAGDGLASRALGYGIQNIRVDGNDIFAVYSATQLARHVCVTEKRPVLIEAMTYRIGGHTSYVDSEDYRTKEEVEFWMNYCPIKRLRRHLTMRGWWTDESESRLRDETENKVKAALKESEVKQKPNPELLFTDVYKNMEPHIRKQQETMKQHVSMYKDQYPLEQFEKWD